MAIDTQRLAGDLNALYDLDVTHDALDAADPAVFEALARVTSDLVAIRDKVEEVDTVDDQLDYELRALRRARDRLLDHADDLERAAGLAGDARVLRTIARDLERIAASLGDHQADGR